MDGGDETTLVDWPTESVQVDASACTADERRARRLEDAVERSISDLDSEHDAGKSLPPEVRDQHPIEP